VEAGAEVGDVCECGAFMWDENYGYSEFFCGGGVLLSRMFILDERCPETLMSVIVQNLNEIGQSAAEL